MTETNGSAWQPFTPGGVARFAAASAGRLLAVQVLVALLAAGTVTWCVVATWFPVLETALNRLPNDAALTSGCLDWPGDSPQLLAEGRCLAVVVDLQHSGALRSAADVQVQLGRTSVRVESLLGYMEVGYTPGLRVALGRPVALPWWGAWSPAILAGVCGCTFAGLLLAWAVAATVYCVPVWLLGFLAGRVLDLRGAWRLAAAAQLPGAVLLTAALAAYGLGWADPVRLLVAFGAHFVVSWIYLVASPLTLQAAAATDRAEKNPFASTSVPAAPTRQTAQPENPFRTENP